MKHFFVFALLLAFVATAAASWFGADAQATAEELSSGMSTGEMSPSIEQLMQFLGPNADAVYKPFPALRSALIGRITEWASDVLGWDKQSLQFNANAYPYFGFLPPYEASVLPDGPAVSWSAPCFKSSSARLVTNPNGTFTLNVTVADGGLLCSDFYLFATLQSVSFEEFSSKGVRSILWSLPANASAALNWDIKAKGIRIFRFRDTIIQTISDLLSTVIMFGSELTQGIPDIVAKANLDFMSKYPRINMTERATQEVTLDESIISSGDFLGIIRLDGLDPMLAWAMGSTTGHTAVALRMNGTLYVVESTVKDSYWPTDGIQKTPYSLWVQQAKAAGYQVVWAPLSAQYKKQFNETAAINFFESVEGFEYGYHNLLFGWIDTIKDNYPCLPPDYTSCLRWEHVEIIVGLADHLLPSVGDLLFNQGLNIRMNTTGLGAADLFYQAHLLGINITELPSVVESDSWLYQTTRNGQPAVGPAMVCCVFVCRVWKAAGIFSEIGDQLNCGELTNWDDYVLNVFDTTTPRPAQCVAADPNNTNCQIEGKYTLQLNNYASKTMYPHMAEHCPSEAPNYNKPANC